MSKIEEFFNGALVSWLKSLIPEQELIFEYHSLINGVILNKVWNLIDPQSDNNQIYSSNQFTIIVYRMKSFYEERLGQVILTLPDCAVLGNSPQSLKGLEQMKLLLKLFLGAAVQCPRKEYFINLLKKLNVETQFSLVDIIKKVTDNESFVLTSESSKQLSSKQMFNNLRRVTKERCIFNSNFFTEIEIIMDNGRNSRNFLEPKLLELNGIKSQIRKIREQFEEKCEDNNNLKEDLKFQYVKNDKLKIDNQKWYNEAKLLSIYRSEIDYLKERSNQTDRLEIEIEKNREQLKDLEFYKTRVDDLREDYQLLLDDKQNLEVKLENYRKQIEHFFNLKNDVLEIEQRYEQMLLEREKTQKKLKEMAELNNELQLALNEDNSKIIELDNEIYELKSKHESEEKDKGRENLSLKLLNLKLIERWAVAQDESEQIKRHLHDTKLEVLEFQERETRLEKLIDEFKLELKTLNNCSDDLIILREQHLKLEDDFNALYILHQELKETKEVVKKSFGSNLLTKFRKSRATPCLQNKLALNDEVAGSRKAVYIINEEGEGPGNENNFINAANESILSAGWEEFGCI